MSSFETNTSLVCSRCACQFSSRNKLFQHIKRCATLQKLQSLLLIEKEMQEQQEKVAIMVLGGRLRGRTLASVECFDVAAGKWINAAIPAMNENRGSHAAASIGNEVYVIGGGGFDSNLSACEKYSPDAGWTSVASLCTPRHALGAAVVDGRLFAVGGWINGSVCSDDVEMFDAAGGQWMQLAKMRLPRRLHGITQYNNTHLYVFGGSCNDPYWHTAEVEKFDLRSNSWSPCAALPDVGGNAAATVSAPSGEQLIFIFVFGKRVYCYDPEQDVYVPRAALPVHDWHCFQVIAVGRNIFAMGGAAEGKWSRVAYRYDTASDVWTKMPDMHTPRRRCAIALVPMDSISRLISADSCAFSCIDTAEQGSVALNNTNN